MNVNWVVLSCFDACAGSQLTAASPERTSFRPTVWTLVESEKIPSALP